MATKKTQQNSDLSLDVPGSEADLDQAIAEALGEISLGHDLSLY